LIFYRAYLDEEDEYLPRKFYCPWDLETSNVETETGIGESQEAIDDFIDKWKSANTNEKIATVEPRLSGLVETRWNSPDNRGSG